MVPAAAACPYSSCDVVTLNTAYTHTPFTAKVETLMRSIADKIATRTAIPNNSAEVGFVNQTTKVPSILRPNGTYFVAQSWP